MIKLNNPDISGISPRTSYELITVDDITALPVCGSISSVVVDDADGMEGEDYLNITWDANLNIYMGPGDVSAGWGYAIRLNYTNSNGQVVLQID